MKRSQGQRVARLLSLYEGRHFMGRLVENEQACRAFDAAGKALGKFANRAEAIAAVEASYAQAGDE
jgi:hypothetical protein